MSRSEHNFNRLRHLLGCKRYEQPPPGYFSSFSDKVIARIEAEEAAEYCSWWSWLVDRFDARPVFVCVYGLAVSGLLLMGIRLAHAFETESTATRDLGGPWLATTPGSSLLFFRDVGQVDFTRAAAPAAFSPSKWTLRQESHTEFVPASTFRLQPAGFLLETH